MFLDATPTSTTGQPTGKCQDYQNNMINSDAEIKLFFLLYLVSSLVFTTFCHGATLTNIAAKTLSELKTLG